MSSTSALSGFLEEVETRFITSPKNSTRRDLGDVKELKASIHEKGLLQPIVVRPAGDGYEVVAGNRRLTACVELRMYKIACHVVDLTDKEAYELSLIENIQRQTLDPIEEAEALKRYVDEYGYGSVTELALKIGKSEEYVSHRIGLLTLPKDVLERVSRRLLTPSHAAELKGLRGEEQSRIAELLSNENISSKEARKMVRRVKRGLDGGPFFLRDDRPEVEDDSNYIDRVFGKCITALKITMMRLDNALDGIDERNWPIRESLLESRQTIHHEIDNMLRLKRKTRRARVFLERQR